MAMEEAKTMMPATGPLLSLAKAVKLGENPTELSYAKLPVEDFGKTMMRKMGWTEGTGIGRNPQRGLVQPIEFLPRHHRLGLGATPLPTMRINGGNENKEIAPSAREKGALQSRNYKYLDEKLSSKENLIIGTEILINKGKHEGMYGRIVEIVKSSNENDVELYVELLANDQVVKIEKSKVTVSKKKQLNSDSVKEKHHQKKKNKLRWVTSGILVRIISKSYSGGKYYNKKVKVEDVPDRRNFIVTTEDGVILEDLRESDVETVMPQLMDEVMILVGSKRGEIGKMIMRDKKKDLVKVQLYDESESVISCSQDDCCALKSK